MKQEYEVVEHANIRHLKISVNRIAFRTPHMHRDFEVIHNLKGDAYFTLGHQNIEFPEGSILLINPNQMHTIHSIAEDSLMIVLQVAPEFFASIYPSISHLSFEPHCLSGPAAEKIHASLIQLTRHYLLQNESYEFACGSLVLQIFHDLLNIYPHHLISDAEKKTFQTKARRLDRIIRYAQEHYTEKISLEDIARSENLSVSYLSHFIKSNFNQSFQDYIAKLRLNQATFLIHDPGKRLIDICEECGYSDYRYLYQAFMNEYHCSPKAYRSRHLKVTEQHKAVDGSKEYFLSKKEVLATLRL